MYREEGLRVDWIIEVKETPRRFFFGPEKVELVGGGTMEKEGIKASKGEGTYIESLPVTRRKRLRKKTLGEGYIK